MVTELEDDNRELRLEVEALEMELAHETAEDVGPHELEFPGEAGPRFTVKGYRYLEATLEVPYEEHEQEATEEELGAAFDAATVPGDADYQEPLVDVALEAVPVVDVDVINGRPRFTKPGNILWISSITRLAQVLERQPETMPVWPKGSVQGVAKTLKSYLEDVWSTQPTLLMTLKKLVTNRPDDWDKLVDYMREQHPNHLRDVDHVKKLRKPVRHPADEWVLGIMYYEIARSPLAKRGRRKVAVAGYVMAKEDADDDKLPEEGLRAGTVKCKSMGE